MNGPLAIDERDMDNLAGTLRLELRRQAAQRESNARFLQQLISAQRNGLSVLPYFLGLNPLDYIILVKNWLPSELGLWLIDETQPGFDIGLARQELLELRRDEWLDLRNLLVENRSGNVDSEVHLAGIVAAGCLGGNHLWRDLGLATRGDLSAMLALNFAPLAERNVKDMKWKKFFYKQLCEGQGGYVCRAPSCEVCAAFEECFGPED